MKIRCYQQKIGLFHLRCFIWSSWGQQNININLEESHKHKEEETEINLVKNIKLIVLMIETQWKSNNGDIEEWEKGKMAEPSSHDK